MLEREENYTKSDKAMSSHITRPMHKPSNSSVKLPPIDRYSNYNHSSKNTLCSYEISLKSVKNVRPNSNRKLKALRPASINEVMKQGNKSKSKRKAESIRFKTEGISNIFQKETNPENTSTIDDEGLTLRDFKKHIQINKQHIHSEISKRLKMNRNSERNIMLDNKKMNELKILKRNRNSCESDMFSSIQGIINKSQVSFETIDLEDVENTVKMAQLESSIKKLSRSKESSSMKTSIISEISENSKKNRESLKNEMNYHLWRKVEISPKKPTLSYSETNFELESEKLGRLSRQTEDSLTDYLENRIILLELKSKYSIC